MKEIIIFGKINNEILICFFKLIDYTYRDK